MRNLIERLLPDPLLRVDAPTSTETSVLRQGRRTIVHLLQYAPERRTPTLDLVEDIVPLREVPVSLRLERAPARVYLAPSLQELPFAYDSGRARVVVPEIRGHEMVVFE